MIGTWVGLRRPEHILWKGLGLDLPRNLWSGAASRVCWEERTEPPFRAKYERGAVELGGDNVKHGLDRRAEGKAYGGRETHLPLLPLLLPSLSRKTFTALPLPCAG